MRAPGHEWSFSLFISIFPLARLTLIGCLSCLWERGCLWVKTEPVTVSVSVAAADAKIYRCSPAVPPHMFDWSSYIRCWCNGGQDQGKRRKTIERQQVEILVGILFLCHCKNHRVRREDSGFFLFQPESYWPMLRKTSTRLCSSVDTAGNALLEEVYSVHPKLNDQKQFLAWLY